MGHLQSEAHRKSYSTHMFATDESDDPHQWCLVFKADGARLCILMRYCGRRQQHYDLSSPPITASFNITCAVDKRNLRDGSVQVQLQKFVYGVEEQVAAFDTGNLPSQLIEIRILDVFVM